MRRPSLVSVAIALAAAVAQFRLIVAVLGDQYVASVEAAKGIVDGYPHWRIYQSRVLGPYAVEALSRVFPGYMSAYVAFTIVALAVAGALAWRLGERVAGAKAGAPALAMFHLAFAMLLATRVVLRWLYVWDYLDAIVFLLFVDFVVAERPWPWFVALFSIGLLNHEICNFIALWLVGDALLRWWIGRREGNRLRWQQLVAGVVCMVASFVVVEWLRSTLLVEQIGPKIFHEAPADIGSSFYFTLFKNLHLLGRIFSNFEYELPQLVPIFLAVVIGVAVWLGRREPLRFGALAVVHVLLVGSLLTFGVLLETRIYIVLVPLLVLATSYALRPQAVQ